MLLTILILFPLYPAIHCLDGKDRNVFNTVQSTQLVNATLGTNKFKFIGSTMDEKSFPGISATKISNYFVSSNSAEWFTALSDCRKFFGENASLACVETQHELLQLGKFLQDTDATVGDFWMGGKFENIADKFLWVTGVEIEDWAPWDSGYPNSRHSTTRVSGINIGKLKYRTTHQTVPLRYICELNSFNHHITTTTPSPSKPNDTAVTCPIPSNLIVVVDGSLSVGISNFKTALNFTANLVTSWMSNPKSRTSVITYSSKADTLFTLEMSRNLGQGIVRDKIINAGYDAKTTASHLALQQVLMEFGFPDQVSQSIPNIMLFITDGASDNPQKTKYEARRIKDVRIQSFSLGIGKNLNEAELLTIAGGNKNQTWKANDFQDLLQSLRDVSVKLCRN